MRVTAPTCLAHHPAAALTGGTPAARQAGPAALQAAQAAAASSAARMATSHGTAPTRHCSSEEARGALPQA